MEHLYYKERLRELELFIPKKRRLWGRSFCGLSILKGENCKQDFSTKTKEKKKRKKKEGRFRLDIRKKSFL